LLAFIEILKHKKKKGRNHLREGKTKEVNLRTEVIYFRGNKVIKKACHHSNSLYNQGNYLIRQTFFKKRIWLRYNNYYHQLKTSPHYQALPSQTGQQILRLLEKNWKAFFQVIKEWNINPMKFLGRPKPPKYRVKTGENLLVFTFQQLRYKNGNLLLPKNLGSFQTRIRENLQGARILPQGVGYKLEIIYQKEPIPLKPQRNRIVSIDLGVNNLITMVNNIGEKPIVINGKSVKAVNQYFNKQLSKLQSQYDKSQIKSGRKHRILLLKRKRLLSDRLHKASRYIVNWCLQHQIDTVIVGYNTTWKQQVALGKVNNQQFVNIPFYQLLKQFEYKCEDEGLQLLITAENYTSKCSFLDHESIQKHAQYKGRRICRGLFRSHTGRLINADVNAAYNIMSKVVPNAFPAEGIVDVGLHPKRIELFV
jgi:putative transposase